MGYTRYWGFKKDADMKAYKSALKDIGTMVKANTNILGDGAGEGGEPTVKPNEIRFNGKDGDDYETFSLDSKLKGGFCKTNRKPYDEFVGASLLILKDYLGDQVDIDSDGSEGDDGKAMAKKYSKAKPDLKLVKNESYNLNNEFSMINECVSSIEKGSTSLGFAKEAFNNRKKKNKLNESNEEEMKSLDDKEKLKESDDDFYDNFDTTEFKVRVWSDKKGKLEKEFRKDFKAFMKEFSKKHKGSVPEIEDLISTFPVIL